MNRTKAERQAEELERRIATSKQETLVEKSIREYNGTKDTVTGIVQEVEIKEVFFRRSCYLNINVTLLLKDGTKAYVSTKVGNSPYKCGVDYKLLTNPSFAKEVTEALEPRFQQSDTITVQGTIKKRASRYGNSYLAISRAKLVDHKPTKEEAYDTSLDQPDPVALSTAEDCPFKKES